MAKTPILGNEHLHQDIMQWACKYLISLGYTLKNNLPTPIVNTPWSYLVRFETSDGSIYLKQTPDLFALEPNIIQVLQDQFQAPVPIVIGHNPELNCFLMKDAGSPLRDILKNKFDSELFCKAIDQFTLLQIKIAEHVNIFLEMGVPDYRLNQLSDLYSQFMSKNDLLTAEGLSDSEINHLKSLTPKISSLAKKLANDAVKDTLVQPDFNDNNTLIHPISKKITIIDLGEIVISHPFFSLFNCLENLKKYHNLTDQHDIYLKIQEACFKNYMIFFESKKHLTDAMAIAKLLYFAYGLAGQYRFMLACGRARLKSFQHWKLGQLLRDFMLLNIDDSLKK